MRKQVELTSTPFTSLTTTLLDDHPSGITCFRHFIVDVIAAGGEVTSSNLQNISRLSTAATSSQVNSKTDFFKVISSNENKLVTFKVYDVLLRNFQEVSVTPNKDWSNSGSLLGITLRFEDYANAHNNSLAVLSVSRLYLSAPITKYFPPPGRIE